MRNKLVPLLLGTSALTAAPFTSDALADSSSGSRNNLSIAVFGDSPYGTSNGDTAQYQATPAFIDTINADRDVSLVLNVGDIHSGKQFCSETYDRAIYGLWTGTSRDIASSGFQDPLIYTPGDNEWTDCHKSGEGSQDPLTNLGYVRQIFFVEPRVTPTNGNAIAVDKPVLSQADNFDPKYPNDKNYVENLLWEQSKIVFVTLNIPGGSNNDEDNWFSTVGQTDAQKNEILDRTGADLRWLDKAFAMAQANRSNALVIQVQADMWDLDGKPPAHIGAYRQFIDSIALKATVFGKPVLLLNGDSHNFRSDNPLVKGATCITEKPGSQADVIACADDAYSNQPYGYSVKNFHRLVVHGSVPNMEWLKLTIKPGESEGRSSDYSYGPFSWQRMITDLPPAP